MKAFALLLLIPTWLLVAPAAAGAQAKDEWQEWNRPVEPFQVYENIYYVGAENVSSFLIATDQGHLLLDGGFAETAAQILANVRALGFRPEDVKYLLNSHAHFDHAGGLAGLKLATGARLLALAAEAPLLEAGGAGDFAFGDEARFPPVGVDRKLADGEAVALGPVALVAHLTPGHTRGCTTWTMRLGGGEPELHALFLCSVTAPGYRLVGNPAWPEIAEAYEATFRVLERLPCDLFLAAHGWDFDLDGKRRRAAMGLGMAGGGTAGGPANPFLDPEGCRRHLAEKEQEFRAELERQRAAAQPPS